MDSNFANTGWIKRKAKPSLQSNGQTPVVQGPDDLEWELIPRFQWSGFGKGAFAQRSPFGVETFCQFQVSFISLHWCSSPHISGVSVTFLWSAPQHPWQDHSVTAFRDILCSGSYLSSVQSLILPAMIKYPPGVPPGCSGVKTEVPPWANFGSWHNRSYIKEGITLPLVSGFLFLCGQGSPGQLFGPPHTPFFATEFILWT